MSASILQNTTGTAPARRTLDKGLLAGRILTGIALAFLTFDTVFKLIGASEAVEGTMKLGFTAQHLTIIGLIELACLVVYVIPRTSPIGAVLFTGYFGGAIVTHLRLDNPLFSHILFPTYLGAMMWLGLYLRDARVRTLLHPKS
ncbi:MAG: DoxX family protein [Phycisphaerae bacterium]|nr:DoxX family protein [Gemmatimonadaceae bacterium]